MESFPHQVSTQGVCRQPFLSPDFPPAPQRRIWGVDKHPPCEDCIGGKGSSPDVQQQQLQRFLPLQSSSQLSSLTSTKTTSAKTKQISTDLPLNTVRKMPMKAGNTSPALPPPIHSSSPSCKQQHLTDPFRHHRMLNRQIMIFLLNRRKNRRRRKKVGKTFFGCQLHVS